MKTLRIEHAVTDYAEWKPMFDQYAEMRRSGGVLRHRLHRPAEDPAYVLIELDFGTGDEAARFLEFLKSKVWASPATAPALVGTPQTRILDLVEQS